MADAGAASPRRSRRHSSERRTVRLLSTLVDHLDSQPGRLGHRPVRASTCPRDGRRGCRKPKAIEKAFRRTVRLLSTLPQMACRIQRETSGRSSRSPRFSTRPPGPSPGPRIDVPPRWPTRVPQAQGDREGIRASGGPFGSCRLSDPQMACRIQRETSGRSSRSPRFSTRPPGPSPGPRIDVPPRWPTRVPQAQGDREGIRASGGPFGSCRLSDPQMACRIQRETSGRSSRSPRFSTRPPGPSPGPRIDVPPRWPTRVPQAQGDREGIRASGGPFGSCRLSDPQMACRIQRETSGRSSRSPRFSTRPPGPSPGPRIDVPPRWPTRVPQAQGDREGIRASGGPFGSCRLSDPQMACRIQRVKPLAPHARP